MQAVFDPELSLQRKRRALRQGVGDADFLMRRVAGDLEERLATIQKDFPEAATLFSLSETARTAVLASGKARVATRIEVHQDLLGAGPSIVAAAETVPLPHGSLDLAVSLLALQEVNDVPGLLVQIRRALRPDGLFLGAMAGAGTLDELRDSLLSAETELTGGASPRVAPFIDVRDAGALLQRAGFALPVTDIEPVTVRYDNMFALIRDLRSMGATNTLVARSRRPASRELFRRAAEIYAERHADRDGRIRATFSIIWMSGWAPAPSQQKPLKPGSAKGSLEAALRRIEEGGERG